MWYVDTASSNRVFALRHYISSKLTQFYCYWYKYKWYKKETKMHPK